MVAFERHLITIAEVNQRLLSSTLRILSSVSERGCNSMVQGSRKFLDISVGSG